jgi:hypothetical protein
MTSVNQVTVVRTSFQTGRKLDRWASQRRSLLQFLDNIRRNSKAIAGPTRSADLVRSLGLADVGRSLGVVQMMKRNRVGRKSIRPSACLSPYTTITTWPLLVLRYLLNQGDRQIPEERASVSSAERATCHRLSKGRRRPSRTIDRREDLASFLRLCARRRKNRKLRSAIVRTSDLAWPLDVARAGLPLGVQRLIRYLCSMTPT